MGVGAPGSGKTTHLMEAAEVLGIARISPDEIREELTGDMQNQSVNKEAWEETFLRAKSELGLGRSAIIDATHAEAWRRTKAIEQYRSYGAAMVVAVMFNPPLETIKQRNASRERVVPEHVIDRMAGALKENPPSTEEGFDEVIEMQENE